jgi:3-hydroxyisobutyrate dehydrogenase-like beta-hydroxyacid dehydrogenase
MEVGLIGLGKTGAAVARNLLTAGHQLTVVGRTQEDTRDLAAAGAIVADRVRDACNVDVVITILPTDQGVEEIVLGPGGVADAMPAAATHISMSTIGIALSRRLAAIHAQRIQRYVAAPMFGRASAAAKGELFIFAGGREDTIWRCQPLFDVVGCQTVLVGRDPAEANLLQLCAVGLVSALAENLGEAIMLADRGGIGQERFLKLMSRSVFATGLHASYGALIARTCPPAVLTVEQGDRNAALILNSADALGVPMPLMRVLRDRLNALTTRGLGDQDWLSISRSGAAEDSGNSRATQTRPGTDQAEDPWEEQ